MSKTEKKVTVTITHVDCYSDDPMFGVYEYLMAQKKKENREHMGATGEASWTSEDRECLDSA